MRPEGERQVRDDARKNQAERVEKRLLGLADGGTRKRIFSKKACDFNGAQIKTAPQYFIEL